MLGVLSLVQGRLRSSADGSGSGTEVVLVGGRDGVTEEETEGTKKEQTSSSSDSDSDGEGRRVTLGGGNSGRDDHGGGGVGRELRRGSVISTVSKVVNDETQGRAVTRSNVETDVREPLVEGSDAVQADPSGGAVGSARSGSGESEVSLSRDDLEGHLLNVSTGVNVSNRDGVVVGRGGDGGITQEGVSDSRGTNDLSGGPDGRSVVDSLDEDQSRDGRGLSTSSIHGSPGDGNVGGVGGQRSGNESEAEVGLAVAGEGSIAELEDIQVSAISGDSLVVLDGDSGVLGEIGADSLGDISRGERAVLAVPGTSNV